MSKISGDGPKVYVTSRGSQYVVANELFRTSKVRKTLDEMVEIERKSKKFRNPSEPKPVKSAN